MKRSYTTCLVLLVTFLVVSIANAEQFQKKEFSISLPDEWEEIPREVMLAREEAAAKAAPSFAGLHFDGGFILPISQNWIECPSVTVKVLHKGRIPQWQLDKQAIEEPNDKAFKTLSPKLSDIGIGKSFYDQQSGIVWMRVQATVNDTAPVSLSILSAMIPTEDGTILVEGCSLTKDYSSYEPVFQSIAKSVTPIPSLAHKPRPSDYPQPSGGISNVFNWLDWRHKGIMGSITGLLCLAIILMFLRILRQSSSKTC